MKKKTIIVLVAALALIGVSFTGGYLLGNSNSEKNNDNIKEEQKKTDKDNKEEKPESTEEDESKPDESDKEENEDKLIPDSVASVYIEEKYNTKNKKGTIITKNTRNVPTIKFSSNQKAADKIEQSLKKISDDKWTNEIKSEADRTSMSEEYQNLTEYEGLGATLYFKKFHRSNQLITFNLILEGGFGGVAWYEYKSYSYDITTGEQLLLKDLTNDYNSIEKVLLSEIKNKLKTLKDVYVLEELTDKQIIDHFNKTGNWEITEKGITITFQKGEIADNASGALTIDIDKSKINQYLKDEYKI